jgi:hypothetical protein
MAQENTFGLIGEGEATLVRDAVIFSVDVKPMQVGITPPHGNLNRVMEVGNALVAPYEQSPPDHRANTTQNDIELVNAQHLAPGIETYCIATAYAAKRLNSVGSTHFLCSPPRVVDQLSGQA